MMSMDTLLRDLREGTTERRQHAATALRDYGTAVVEPLCLALRDKDLSVRIAAAESLGHVGDERAVQALMEALRDCFLGGRATLPFVVGLLPLYFFAVIWMNYSEWVGVLGIGGTLVWWLVCYYPRRRTQSKVCQAIIDALAHLAEHRPTPELRIALPDLKTVAGDVILQDKHTRTASRQAAQRIEALTEQLKSLPLPASAPETERLPRVIDG